eukprot:7356767-Alexandrium_andersonii.AAC.1
MCIRDRPNGAPDAAARWRAPRPAPTSGAAAPRLPSAGWRRAKQQLAAKHRARREGVDCNKGPGRAHLGKGRRSGGG